MSSSTQNFIRCTPNILPCLIQKTGPISATERYWAVNDQNNITTDKETTKVAYFRGRKLLGKEMKVGAGYRGVVARVKDDEKTQTHLASEREPQLARINGIRFSASTNPEDQEDDDDEDGDADEDVNILEEVAEFGEVIVWGHETLPEDDDTFVRGIEEWISFAEDIHSYDEAGCEKP